MRQRITSAVMGLVLLGVIIGLYNTYFLNLSIAAVCVIGLDELLHGANFTNKPLNYLAYSYAAIVPFLQAPSLSRHIALVNCAFAILAVLAFLAQYKRVAIGELAVTILFCGVICYSLASLVACRDLYGATLGLYYNLIALIASWGTDTGAYFSGRLLGRHKLAPNISPNKTVEGAIGGGIFGVAATVAVSWFYTLYQSYVGVNMTVYYGRLLCVLPVLVVAGMAGDLFASAIKRQYKIKDFGHIMPGHGGVLDRFDSVLAVAPMVYVFVTYMFPLASLA